jgi:DNA-binding NtrC family response regulator
MSIESTPPQALNGDATLRANEISVCPEEHFFAVKADAGVPPPLEVVERAYVARVLNHTAGRRLAAAHLLGISYPTFLKRLRELGIDHAVPRTKRVDGV